MKGLKILLAAIFGVFIGFTLFEKIDKLASKICIYYLEDF